MAFTLTYFAPLGATSKRGDVSAVYNYNNKDGDTVTGASYFDDVFTMLSVDDVIKVYNYTASDVSAEVTYAVTDITAGVVTIAAITAT